MSRKKILICDDVRDTERRWQQRLEALPVMKELPFEVDIVEPGDLLKSIRALENRRKEARTREDPAKEYPTDEASELDQAGILVVDFDLLELEGSPSVSGEDVAYLARCYSSCGLIVALNQFERGRSTFDLKLRGHPETFADLNIGAPQLDNPGLWSEPWEGFRPWAWPLLRLALEKSERRIRELSSRLDESILDYLGLLDLEKGLPRSTVEFLTESDTSAKTSFRDFVTKSGNGMRRKDKPFSEESIARIAAARVAKWLEYLVLPGQDVFVDAPHLISRYPSLLGDGSDDMDAWNRTTSFESHDKLGLDDVVQKFCFKQDDWLSRPAWLLNEVSRCEDIEEIADPWSTTWPNWVFCEDISRFLPREATREFVADLPSQFVHRFVVDLRSPKGKRFADELEQVVYESRVRLLL